jgi:hypothetical protein
MIWTPPPRHRVTLPVITPLHDEMAALAQMFTSAPTSGTFGNRAHFWPIYLTDPFTVAKAFWCNGATVGTDTIDIGVYRMTDMTTGRCDLIRSTGAVLSAGSANVVQEVSTWKVAANTAALTTDVDSTDATSYTTASVTLKAGRLYLLSFVNTAADAAVSSGIAGGPTWTSRSTTQYNGTAHRVSIWSGVPTVDYTGTIVISFGATQTSGRWSLNEFSGVDTATTNGVVQQAVGTGNDTTPLATLAAFGSANNATFGALANEADASTTPGSGFTELSDPGGSSFLQTQWQVGNDTTVDGTITSGQWGACAVEIKADASAFIIPPSLPGVLDVYLGFGCTGTTATFLRLQPSIGFTSAQGVLGASNSVPLPTTLSAATTATGSQSRPLAGFSSRSLIG